MFSAKAAFLLVAAGLIFHLSVVEVVLLVGGYTVFDKPRSMASETSPSAEN